jgi:hypothetical protein
VRKIQSKGYDPAQENVRRPPLAAIKCILLVSRITLVLFGLCLPVNAELGGDQMSVRDDQTRMQGLTRIIAANAYTVYEIRNRYGTVVREFVSSGGQVFGIAWQDPSLPSCASFSVNTSTNYRQLKAIVAVMDRC